MATGVTGYFDLAGDYGVTVRIHYKETYDETTNASVVAITGVQVASSWNYGMTYYLDGTITVAGSTAVSMSSSAGSHAVRISALSTFATAGGTLGSVSGITHNTDGSKSITISASLHGYTLDGTQGSGWAASGSKAVTLATIPRASTIGATDANIGAVSMIAVARKSSNYTHTIQYQFGSLSGYITAEGGISTDAVKLTETSISFIVPTSFFAQIPNAKAADCTLTCITYSGSTQIGAAQTCKFTCTAAQATCAPAVSGTVVDDNAATAALTGNPAKLVRYHSTALCTITAAAKNSATIVSKTIGGVAVSGNTRSIENVETGAVTFSATDSRGYTSSVTVENTLVAYVQVTNNATAQRTDPTSGNAVLSLSGAWFNGSFGAEANALTAQYRINGGSWVAVPLTYDGDSYTATVNLSGLTYTESFKIEVMVTDALESVTKAVTILPGIPVFDWGESDFNFNVPVKFNGATLLDLVYPVGSIYLSYSDISPEVLFGGTWTRIENRFLWAIAEGETIGKTGGESTHTLTVDEMPSHTHTMSNRTASTGDYYNLPPRTAQAGTTNAGIATVIDAAGGGKAHNNMPPYIQIAVWRRTE